MCHSVWVKYLLAGASGFLGSALSTHLASQGHEVVRLVRHEPRSSDERRWDPYAQQLNPDDVAGSDVVVNLSGAPIARWWTSKHKERIRSSRVACTRTIAAAMASLDEPPVLLNQSGVHAYGDGRGDDVLTEESTPGSGFLAEVVQTWEAEAMAAAESGARVCMMRTSVVLDRRGGALKLMLIPFRLGVGGRLGDGGQYFSVVSLTDWVRAVSFLGDQADATGPYNLTGPQAPTNAQFTAALAAQLHRPARLRVPSFALKAATGELSGELLGSLRVRPQRLLDAGFTFDHPDVESIVSAALAG
jgi:uncharacterized protein (TIGR01777 family)